MPCRRSARVRVQVLPSEQDLSPNTPLATQLPSSEYDNSCARFISWQPEANQVHDAIDSAYDAALERPNARRNAKNENSTSQMERTIADGMRRISIDVVKGQSWPSSSRSIKKTDWRLSESQKEIFERLKEQKELGRQAFMEDRLSDAFTHYRTGLAALFATKVAETGESKAGLEKKWLIPLLLNCAQCKLKLGELSECNSYCSRVLALDPQNIKALYRRCQALMEQNDLSRAQEDLDAFTALTKNGLDANRLKRILDRARAVQLRTERKMAKAMFSSSS
mmetsp:Transcript_6776/g.12523  ORF Transcript_6776/g.12523 Transcript_6776/m.12523 type:complete len:280 (+) Transcript_6776:58-897(+)